MSTINDAGSERLDLLLLSIVAYSIRVLVAQFHRYNAYVLLGLSYNTKSKRKVIIATSYESNRHLLMPGLAIIPSTPELAIISVVTASALQHHSD